MLTNSEIWFNVTETEIEELESVDRVLLRQILQVPKSTPIPSLYLELGCTPIRYIIKGKRIMYLHNILSRSKNELVSKVLDAQTKKPVKNGIGETSISTVSQVCFASV